MEPTINNLNDVRSATALLTAHVNKMCNADNTEAVAEQFSEAKDLLIALFKYNVERVRN